MMSDIADYFPKFTGEKKSEKDGKNFLASMFQQRFIECENGGKDRKLFIHCTCATDTKNMKKIFDDLQETVLGQHIEELNLA